MLKKLCGFIGAIVLIAAIAVGGYGKAFGGIHQNDERQNDNHRFERRLTNRRKT